MKKIRSVLFYTRHDTNGAKSWRRRIEKWLTRQFPTIRFSDKKPDLVIVLGGDGTILEAVRNFHHSNPLFIGLNLGTIGFLASVRNRRNFWKGLKRVFKGDYCESKRMMAAVSLTRNGKKIFCGKAFNDILVQNFLGTTELDVKIDGTLVQEIRGSGVLVATASGSTAYNLSAHGPIVMPEIKCFIISEMFDHNTPTPTMIIKRTKTVSIKIKKFRLLGELSWTKTGEPIDVALIIDGGIEAVLKKGDTIQITRTNRLVRLVELENNYFFKSLHQKFTFQ